MSYAWSVILDTIAARDDAARAGRRNPTTTPTRRSPSPRTRSAPSSSARSTASRSTGCSSPEEYTELLPGEHTFEVRAVDLAEPNPNVDPTPESYTWTILGAPDTTPPETRILNGPPATTASLAGILHVRRRVRLHLRVPARRGAGRGVRVAVRSRGRARRARLPGAGDRRGAQRRPDAGGAPLDGPRAAGDDDQLRPGRDERELRSRPSTSPPTRPTRGSTARSTGSGSPLCSPGVSYAGLIDGEHTFEVAAQNPAGVDGRDAGRVRVDGRGAARDDDRLRAGSLDDGHERRVQLHRERGRLDVRVQPRRGALRRLRVAGRLPGRRPRHGAAVPRPAHVRRSGDRRRGQRRRLARHPQLDCPADPPTRRRP